MGPDEGMVGETMLGIDVGYEGLSSEAKAVLYLRRFDCWKVGLGVVTNGFRSSIKARSLDEIAEVQIFSVGFERCPRPYPDLARRCSTRTVLK